MKKLPALLLKCGIYVSFIAMVMLTACTTESPKPVKVFILAGQSNMVGHGEVEKGIDIDVSHLDLISLEFTGESALGNWADVKAVAHNQ